MALAGVLLSEKLHVWTEVLLESSTGVQHRKAVLAVRRGEYQKAIDHFEAALAGHAGRAAWLDYAAALAKAGRPAELLRLAKRMPDEVRSHPEVLAAVAHALVETGEDGAVPGALARLLSAMKPAKAQRFEQALHERRSTRCAHCASRCKRTPSEPLGSRGCSSERSIAAQQGQRIARDLRFSAKVLQARLGKRPRVLTLRDDLDGGIASVSNLEEIPRRMLEGHPSLELFARDYWAGGPAAKPRLDPPARRVVHADLDLLYDPDAEVQRRNIDRFIDRMLWLKPSTVPVLSFRPRNGSALSAA